MKTLVQHLPSGMSATVKRGVVLRAAVGQGFALCFYDVNREAAGMVHLTAAVMARDVGCGELRVRIERLERELERQSRSLRGGVVDVVGGADLLRTFPLATRQVMLDETLARLTVELARYSIALGRTRVGGRDTRIVELSSDLWGRDFRVRLVSGNHVAVPPGPDLSSPAAAEDELVEDVSVPIGGVAAVETPRRLTAVLGSCVGIALWDPQLRLGALAHVLVSTCDSTRNAEPGRCPQTAVPALLEAIRARGGSPNRVVAKLVGGANLLGRANGKPVLNVGQSNVEASREALARAGVGVVWEDLGGQVGRRVVVDARDFSVSVHFLGTLAEVAP